MQVASAAMLWHDTSEDACASNVAAGTPAVSCARKCAPLPSAAKRAGFPVAEIIRATHRMSHCALAVFGAPGQPGGAAAICAVLCRINDEISSGGNVHVVCVYDVLWMHIDDSPVDSVNSVEGCENILDTSFEIGNVVRVELCNSNWSESEFRFACRCRCFECALLQTRNSTRLL
jgi:hypothetical protein